jgi:hypothetical protein
MNIPHGEVIMKISYDVNSRQIGRSVSVINEQSPGKEGLRSVRPDQFDMILDKTLNTLQKEGPVHLESDTLETLIRIIEKQMNDHCIRSVLRNSGEWRFPGSWPGGLRYLHDVSASINQHRPEQKNDGTAASDVTNRIIDCASEKYGVDADLIKAVIKAESDFDTKATSDRGAVGLMQLMPETAQDLGVKNPYNPVDNVMGGTRYLKMLLDRYDGDTNVALAAYNWGMGNVERHPDRLPEETKTYIARVTKYQRLATA